MGLSNEDYDTKIDKLNEILVSIKINFKIKTVINPQLKVAFELPLYLENHYSRYLTDRELTTTLKSYFDNEEEERSALGKSSDLSQMMGSLTNGLIFMASMAKPRSSLSFRGKMIVGSIQNLR